MMIVIMKIVVNTQQQRQQPRYGPKVKQNNQFMILGMVTTANNIRMFKMGQKDNNFIKGTLGKKKDQSNNRKQTETKIEIELNENQINNTNYDVQSCNDDGALNSKRINEEKDFDKNHTDDDDKKRQDAKEEATDSDVQDLINQLDHPDDQSTCL